MLSGYGWVLPKESANISGKKMDYRYIFTSLNFLLKYHLEPAVLLGTSTFFLSYSFITPFLKASMKVTTYEFSLPLELRGYVSFTLPWLGLLILLCGSFIPRSLFKVKLVHKMSPTVLFISVF